MDKLQQALLEQDLLEKVEEEFQYGYVYEIYPDEEQRQYIHKNGKKVGQWRKKLN